MTVIKKLESLNTQDPKLKEESLEIKATSGFFSKMNEPETSFFNLQLIQPKLFIGGSDDTRKNKVTHVAIPKVQLFPETVSGEGESASLSFSSCPVGPVTCGTPNNDPQALNEENVELTGLFTSSNV